MAKMIRCPAGHVYERGAHDSCPECARTGAQEADEAQVSESKEQVTGEGKKDGKRSLPLPWLASGGVAAVALIAAALFVFWPSPPPPPAPERPSETSGQSPAPAANSPSAAASADPDSDPDYKTCQKASGDEAIAACDRAIASGKFSGSLLANLHNSRGVERDNKKDFAGGSSDYTEAIRLDPKNAAPYRNRGNDHLVKSEYDAAIQDFDQAIQLKPDHFKAYRDRGDAYLKKGDLDHAAADYKKALSLKPDEATKKELEARLNELASRASSPPSGSGPTAQNQNPTPSSGGTTPSEAASSSDKPESPSPQPPASQASNGPADGTTVSADPKTDPDYQACTKGKGEQKLAACDRAIASGKFRGSILAPLYSNRAYLRDNEGQNVDPEAAIADYSEAIKLDPGNVASLVNRANLYGNTGEYDLAIQDLEQAMRLKPKDAEVEAALFNNRGHQLRRKGDLDRAFEDFNHALELDPTFLLAYWNRGLVYQDKGDRDRAISDYKKALSLNPIESIRSQIYALLVKLGGVHSKN